MSGRRTNETSESLDIGLADIRIPELPDRVGEKVGEAQKKTTETIPLLGISSERAFQDLRISALLKEQCYVTEKGLVRVQLELSEHPPLGWSYIFLNVWKESDEAKKARVGIEEDTLWVESEATEFKSRDFPGVQKAIDEANTRFRKALKEQIVAEARREQLDRKTLETILGLELDLTPRPTVKRKNQRLRAYLSPMMWATFSVCWIAAGVWAWQRIPRSEWSFIREPMLIMVWSWVLYGGAERAISQFRQRYRIRKFVLRKRMETVWPEQYVDRRGRDEPRRGAEDTNERVNVMRKT